MSHRAPIYRAGLAALVASAALGASHAAAQDRSFWSRSGPPTDASRSDEASRLYAEARTDLDAGQSAAAQRKLEVLVARYPTSPLADVARRDLQRLYAGTFNPARPTLQPPTPQQPVPAARTIDGPTVQPPFAPAAMQPLATPQPAVVTSVPQAVRDASEEFRHLAGDRIFFSDSSIDLGGRAKAALEHQAAWLTRYPGIEIVIEGHSDDHGSREFNRATAEKRAYAVKLRLNDLGIAADRMSIAVYGRERPVADCAEPSCTAQNRRVVTVITRVPPGLAFGITRNPNMAGQGAAQERGAGVPMR